MSNYYFLLCLLPPLPPSLGEKMQLSFAEVSGIVRRHVEPEDEPLLLALLMGVDAANWEQADQGRRLFRTGGLLSREQMAGRENLPDFIRRFQEEKERGIARTYPYDRLWELYYLSAHAAAEPSPNRFLAEYLSWEIGLRASLAAVRTRDAGVNPEERAILGAFQYGDFSALVSQLRSQNNPLQAERLVDEERLRQIYRFEGSSPFSADALLAYVSRAMLYSRWERISEPFDIENYLWQGGST
jgi:hypothetical protein